MSSPGFAANRDNFCYRHPDRQSFALCQRCLRTICGECQTPAPVGVICPECLAEAQQKTAATARTARVTRMPGAARRAWANDDRPVATYALLALNAVIFLLALLIPGVSNWLVFDSRLLYPEYFGVFQPWRLLTSVFLHVQIWHFLLNMLSLWMIGRILESLTGHGRFLALYLISGLGGSVAVALLAPQTSVLGASGAIFGLLGALLVIGRHLGGQITGILIVVGINLVIGFVPGFGISWQAHVGGLVVGAAIGFIYTRTRRRNQRPAQIALVVGVVLALLGALAIPVLI